MLRHLASNLNPCDRNAKSCGGNLCLHLVPSDAGYACFYSAFVGGLHMASLERTCREVCGTSLLLMRFASLGASRYTW
jgi:hypothetical protein